MCMAMAAGLTATAQNQDKDNDRTVIVEREYAPEINDADKINLLPPPVTKTMPTGEVEYVKTAKPYAGQLDFDRLTLDYSPAATEKGKMGLIYAGYGNRGSANAGIYLTPRTFNGNTLSFKATIQGVNGTRNIDGTPAYDNLEWKARHYSTDVTLDYAHTFTNLTFYTRGSFGLDNFNLRPRLDLSPIDDRGRHTKAQVRLGFRSNSGPVSYGAFADYSFFNKAYGHPLMEGKNNENNIRIGINTAYELNDNSKVGINLDAAGYDYTWDMLRNFATVGINPVYTLNHNGCNIRLGLHIDFVTRGDRKVKVAPDVEASYTFAEDYTLFASAKGGVGSNGYRMLEEINPYWNPAFALDESVRLFDIYKQADIDFGFKAAPVKDFDLSIGGGYDINKGDLCLIGDARMASLSPYSEMTQRQTKVLHGRLAANYAYNDAFALKAVAQIMKWDDDDNAALALKPRYSVEISVNGEIIDNLHLAVSYLHIGRNDKALAGNINDLSARLSYTFYKGLGIYVTATNLTGSSNDYYYAYPSAGTAVIGGLSFEF